MKQHFQRYTWFLIVVVIGLAPLYPLLHPGMFEGHDSQDHVARIANFYANLQEGIIIPRWAENLNWGYGHPILMFLYPLPSYTAALFHAIGFSLIDATKIVFGLGFFLSGLTMYLWIRKLWGREAGAVAAILYLLAPYRFVDLYVRGAIGENFFFIWPPLILYCYHQLIKTRSMRYLIFGSLAMGCMILSHNALSIIYLPLMGVYAVLLILTSSRKITTTLLSAAMTMLGFAVSAFFWIPAYLEGKYTLRDIVTAGEIFKRYEPISRLLYSDWSFGGTGQMSVQVGIVHWIMVFAGCFFIYNLFKKRRHAKDRKKKETYTYYLYLFSVLFLFFWIALFLITPYSMFIYEKVTLFQKFQFPWRWLSLALFPPAVFGGYLVTRIPEKYRLYVVSGIIGIAVVLSVPYWKTDAYFEKPDSFYTSVYEGTTDTGESAPRWSVRFMLERPSAFAEIIEGDAEIRTVRHDILSRVYQVRVSSEQARILENTLYFPGWFVTVDSRELPLTEVWWQDPAYRGLITYFVPQGEHIVTIEFRNTKVRNISEIISAGSLLILAGLSVFTLWKRR